MMPRPSHCALVLLLALSTTACSREEQRSSTSQNVAKDWSSLRDFTAIDATGPDDVSVTIGNAFSIKATGDANAIADLDIGVKGDTLVIGRKGSWSLTRQSDKGATITITMPAITAATLTGSGDLDLDSATGDTLDLSLTGAGDVKIGKATLKSLNADLTGAGSITIAGTADRAKLSITGVGDIDAEGLKVGSADVSVLGTGDIDFASDGKVAINLMGPGDVTVKGKAQCTTNGVGPGSAHCGP